MAAAILCASFVTAFAAEDNGISASGRIIMSENATDSEIFAANTLCDRLNTIFGGYTVSSARDIGDGDIAVGNTALYSPDFSEKKQGSYSIKTVDGCVAINGNGTDGLINGVYEFLDRFCDYEVYEAGIIEYTDAEKLILPGSIDIDYSPFFEYRRVDTRSSYDAEYDHANSINSNIKFADAEGGIVEYISWYGHTLTREFCAEDRMFKDHPEYFALRDGVRTPNQLCLTNEETIKVVTDEVLELLKSKHDPTQNLQIVSLTQDDNQDYCTCDKCAAMDAENGSHAGSLLYLVNKVADRVKQEGYDNVAIDTFAYQWSRTVPAKIKPHDNVIIRLCSIECCYAHPVDSDCPANAEFMKDLRGWSEICDQLYIWDYVNNYSETFLPFPNFDVLQKNVQTFYENGAKGLYEEGNYYMDICDGEFYELRSYLLAKLMENPYRTDYEELMNNYLCAVYGSGGKYLKEYIDITCKLAANHGKAEDKRMHIRQQPKDCLPGITGKQIRQIDKLWASAEEAAETEAQLLRVRKSEISWKHWKCCRFKGEYTLFQSPFKYMKSHVELLKEIEFFGNTAVGEGDIKYLRKNPCRVLFFTPLNWESKFDGKFYDKLDSFAKWLYELSGEKYEFEY